MIKESCLCRAIRFEAERPTMHMFVGSKAPWWEIADGSPKFDEYATE
ncbi:MAG: hypothetical protein ABI724_16450 [Betaproteobacteria bacterium]